MHELLLLFHRWLGLLTAAFILIVAASGSALVFESDMDRALNSTLWRVESSGASLSLDSLADNASSATNRGAVSGLVLPVENRPLVASVGAQQVFVDPHTGRVLGVRTSDVANQGLPRRLHRLHTNLLVGGMGGVVVAIVTGAALLLTLTGLYIWWKERRWRIRWSASWKRIVFDLHHTLGLGASIVLLVMTSTGLILHSRTLGNAIASLDGARTPPPVQHAQPGVLQIVSLDSAVSVARRALPGALVTVISRPPQDGQPVRVTLRFPEDHTPAGRSRVYLDRFTGQVLVVESTRTAGRGTSINNLMRPIHTGDIFGGPTRAIWFIAALILGSQAITGFAMWWNQRAARKASASALRPRHQSR